MRMPSTRVCMAYTLHTSPEGGHLPGRRNVWISDEAAELLDRLGVRNLSSYLLDKLREDDRRNAPITRLQARVHEKREELRAAEAAYEARVGDLERRLSLFDTAAGQAREVVAHDRGRGVQATLLRWVHNHPKGRELREVLPRDFSDERLVDVLLRWPESRQELVRVIEADGAEATAR